MHNLFIANYGKVRIIRELKNRHMKHYNLQIMVTKNKELQIYLNNILQQLQQWLLKGIVEKLVLVIVSLINYKQ